MGFDGLTWTPVNEHDLLHRSCLQVQWRAAFLQFVKATKWQACWRLMPGDAVRQGNISLQTG